MHNTVRLGRWLDSAAEQQLAAAVGVDRELTISAADPANPLITTHAVVSWLMSDMCAWHGVRGTAAHLAGDFLLLQLAPQISAAWAVLKSVLVAALQLASSPISELAALWRPYVPAFASCLLEMDGDTALAWSCACLHEFTRATVVIMQLLSRVLLSVSSGAVGKFALQVTLCTRQLFAWPNCSVKQLHLLRACSFPGHMS